MWMKIGRGRDGNGHRMRMDWGRMDGGMEMGWDGMGWPGMTWGQDGDRMGRDGGLPMTWDGTRQDGMGQDGIVSTAGLPHAECDEQSWGPDCGQRCLCHHGAPCDPLTGVCSCPPGFTDPLCRQPCPPGTYGQGCHLSCPCHHQAPCNTSTGACLCPLGLSGPL